MGSSVGIIQVYTIKHSNALCFLYSTPRKIKSARLKLSPFPGLNYANKGREYAL